MRCKIIVDGLALVGLLVALMAGASLISAANSAEVAVCHPLDPAPALNSMGNSRDAQALHRQFVDERYVRARALERELRALHGVEHRCRVVEVG